jgi:hypothetical protein
MGRLGLDPKNKRGEQPNRKRYSISPCSPNMGEAPEAIGQSLAAPRSERPFRGNFFARQTIRLTEVSLGVCGLASTLELLDWLAAKARPVGPPAF